ncbi:MAG: hypothetical protein ABI417_02905 [Coleofasciculaceae cyanobacterium]
MNIYSTFLLGGLLVTGLAHHSPNIIYRADNSRHFISVQQPINVQPLISEKECSNEGNGSMPGCGRRDL